jgi:hypothetical protein
MILLSFTGSNRLKGSPFLRLRRAARRIRGFSPTENPAAFPLGAPKA